MKTLAMDMNPGSTVRLVLERNQTLATRSAQGMALECLEGGLWITFDGVREDYFLAPGERLPLRARGQIVIQALEKSELMLLQPAAEPLTLPERASRFAQECASAECWRNFVSGLSTQRLSLDSPF